MSLGKLILVPTPIGNLEDMTFRAVRILKEAELVLAEDTRTSKRLLDHYGISTALKSHHQHNEHKQLEELVIRMQSGSVIALISDAGTPGISDPGFLLTRACREAEIEVECLPGATAFVPALVVSGIPTDRFCFEGFLPQKKGRQTRLIALAEEPRTSVLYESPHRIIKLLEQLILHCGEDREIGVFRELTKLHEEHSIGTVSEVLKHYQEKPSIKGEIVVVINGVAPKKKNK
ncbi:MAG: 16S rRNA (cytidine1402-2'-O)-methyltransferase [Limisphaerales bacterium]|jgi:16S rRNA (cytidine1402-2'-O)-methyltransferase